jgi:(1->4)-alpha-D-glucan 1-alpha-D-glucosylmutase
MELARDEESLTLRIADLTFPLSPRSVALLLERTIARSSSRGLRDILLALDRLPAPTATDTESRKRRGGELRELKARLARLLRQEESAGNALDRTVQEINRDPDLLDTVLEEQNYRIAYWRAGSRELGYRRFFDIDDLAALRVEDPEVFAATHHRVLDWVREGVVEGLRIDHPDGLRNPRQYLVRLRSHAPNAWVVVEKILEAGESLRASWPVEGTTGYDFLNDVGGLFVDPAGEEPLTTLYAGFTGDDSPWETVSRQKKEWVLERMLAADLNRLAHLFVRICERNRRFRDYTRHQLREALREVAVSLPVYRTYVEEDGRAEAEDLAVLQEAFRVARSHSARVDSQLLDFLHDILSGKWGGPGEPEAELRMQFQQLTGPVMAKGVEDTAFYTYLRFLPLNDVGGDPSRFGLDPGAFHARCRRAARDWPRSMLALSTHDTKRSEDVRARLFLLSEIPEAWGEAVWRWREMNDPHWSGWEAPDRRTEYLLYQTLVGAFPLPLERARIFLEKAIREAKIHTSWTNPDREYEEAVMVFLARLYEAPEFQEELEVFSRQLVEPGRINSLAQQLVQLTAPGVPDLYQGTELWDLSLVDPDNRRPVDFDLRRTVLEEVTAASPEEVLGRMDRGDPKMWVIRQGLALRKERPEIFGQEAAYSPLPAAGAGAEHVMAFSRGDEAVTVVPRLIVGLQRRGGWGDTTLEVPEGDWVDRLSGQKVAGGRVRLAHILRRFPVALLAREAGPYPSSRTAKGTVAETQVRQHV